MTTGEADGGNEAFPASIFARRIAILGTESAERDDPGNSYPAVNDLERHYPGHGDVRGQDKLDGGSAIEIGAAAASIEQGPVPGWRWWHGRELSAGWPAAADACAAAGQKSGETPGDRKEDSSAESRHLHFPAFPASHVAALGAGGAATPA
ncbi:uncharacterized protein EI90DRAFT_3293738 [Cantharellus anzutake]|uniref:uncharacterized protein n=1 Tax=Cantharellus anzutake TaxID=1750568 RepID=UPI00190412DE|nr:uncharacterized protein EI90DRAFT_3293738 [Cantharellus anzutake]KAF8316225.1 hypothetical protein EI90DRAFT_3293738 [Cantharellus anzutake]